MRINVLKTIKDYKNEDIIEDQRTEVDGKSTIEKVPLIIREVFERAINSLKLDPATKQAELLTTEVRNKIYQINLKLYASNDVDFTVDDLSFIKGRAEIGFVNNPLMYGRICEIVEGIQPADPPVTQKPATPVAAPEKGATQ